MRTNETRKKLTKTTGYACGGQAVGKNPTRDSRNTYPWTTVCELFGREWDGYTYYYSKRLERDQLGIIYDWAPRELEIRLVPQPYGTSNDDPDFEMQIRPLRKGEPLEISYIEELEREALG